jgi:hypothetical protein
MASNSKKKLKIIDYTSRDFNSIKASLVGYAKRYYPDSFKDFNDAGFGALVLDSVAYVGDILSFYLDYQANESFLDSALEYNNVVRLSRQLGYKYSASAVSTGKVQFYIKIPADTDGAPATAYYPTLRAGSGFESVDGKQFTLTEDLYFGAPGNQILIGAVNATTNVPTYFVAKAEGVVVSGRTLRETKNIGAFQKFLKVPLGNAAVTQVLSVVDTAGHPYYEVNHLAQEVIYKSIRNNNTDKGAAPAILKAVAATRRFVLEISRGSAFLQFGYGSSAELTNESVADPSKITLKVYGRDYTSLEEFDPTNLTSTDKFGIAPANTSLTITYRVNDASDVNISANTLTNTSTPIVQFENQGSLDSALRASIVESLEVNNEEPILGDVAIPSVEEIKQRVFSFYATQNRAVTLEDYQAITYAMPPSFGAVKRCSVQRDFDSFKRNLNMYLVSEDKSGFLTTTNNTIKQNLKTWLSRYKIINDTIDLLDARVVNFGIQFILTIDMSENKFGALSAASDRLRNYFGTLQYDIGESLSITDIYKELQKVPNVLDVVDVKIVPQVGGVYSNANFDFNEHLAANGRSISAEKDTIFEVKYPNKDIQGSII